MLVLVGLEYTGGDKLLVLLRVKANNGVDAENGACDDGGAADDDDDDGADGSANGDKDADGAREAVDGSSAEIC